MIGGKIARDTDIAKATCHHHLDALTLMSGEEFATLQSHSVSRCTGHVKVSDYARGRGLCFPNVVAVPFAFAILGIKFFAHSAGKSLFSGFDISWGDARKRL